MTLLVAVLLAADPTPLGVSMLPPSIDLEKYLEPVKPPVPCEPDMTTFEPSPVPLHDIFTVYYNDKAGKKTAWELRPGVLMSECGFVDVINTASDHKRLGRELGVMTQLRIREFELWRQAESQYQVRIVGLEKELAEANTPSFWDEWKGPVMYGLGIATAVAVVVGAASLVGGQ